MESTNGRPSSTNGGSGEREQRVPLENLFSKINAVDLELCPGHGSRQARFAIFAHSAHRARNRDHFIHLARTMERNVAARRNDARGAAREIAGECFHPEI